jgi:hypothetical protein
MASIESGNWGADSALGASRPKRPFLRRREVSRYLMDVWGIQLSVATLAKMAVTGGGPPFYKDGRFPIHDPDLLDDYARERLGALRHSTSDAKAA